MIYIYIRSTFNDIYINAHILMIICIDQRINDRLYFINVLNDIINV